MARLGCHCGADMTNTDGPSPHRLNVFLKSEVDKALSYNPDIPLWDFYTGWDELAECRNSFQNRSEFHVAEYYVTSNMFLNQQRNVIWMVLRNYSFFGMKKWMIFSIWGMIIGLRIIFLN